MLAFAVRQELIPGRRWRIAAPRTFIPPIGPHSRGLCLSGGYVAEKVGGGVADMMVNTMALGLAINVIWYPYGA